MQVSQILSKFDSVHDNNSLKNQRRGKVSRPVAFPCSAWNFLHPLYTHAPDFLSAVAVACLQPVFHFIGKLKSSTGQVSVLDFNFPIKLMTGKR